MKQGNIIEKVTQHTCMTNVRIWKVVYAKQVNNENGNVQKIMRKRTDGQTFFQRQFLVSLKKYRTKLHYQQIHGHNLSNDL
ncbi:hypothetical protein DERF_001186 [Dermatophagoides farinae]|uniref:Uncharacterized protein n=1 Tax=Dermatophagoides farinae TaxID=6954 RepID=A0A922I8Z6_DERFA|nr:hypothetical protein DERF_001186 [Dermatophagoides farinae]